MSNKSKKQQHPKGPARSRGSGNKPRTAENRRKRKARKRAEKRQMQMVRGQKVLATLSATVIGDRAEKYFETEDEMLDAERFEVWNPVSAEVLRQELRLARERKQKALEWRHATHHDMVICLEVMNEEFEALQEEREAKERRRKEYEELRDRNNAKITRIREQIQTLRHKIQNCYDRSKRAYHIAQTRDKAVPYSEQGYKYETECNDLYEEMHRLGREVRERRLKVEADRVDDRFFVAAREEYLAAKAADETAKAELEEVRADVMRLEEELMAISV